jgi:transposase-like protein
MAIVWPTELDVDGYVAAGRELVVPRPACPACRDPMQFWGWHERDVRVTAEVIHRLVVRRARCPGCKRSHVLLPGFVTWGRLDAVEVIGPAVEAMCAGAGMRGVAEGLGLKHTTVRDWRRRFGRRAEMLAVGFCRFCVAVGGLAPRLSGLPEVVALGALTAAWSAARRRFGDGVGTLWRSANAVVGGHLLSPNMDPPWSAT